MYFAFNWPGGVTALLMYSKFGGNPELRGYLKPDNHRNLAVWADRFGSGKTGLLPNYKVSNNWNILFNDGHIKRRKDNANKIRTSNFSWTQAGDYRIQKGAIPKWQETDIAHLWHWFGKGTWQYPANADFN